MFANTLIAEAGCVDFKSGALSLSRFMDGLALIWAGLPRADGYSAYHGRSGNRAAVSRAFFETQMKAIFGEVGA